MTFTVQGSIRIDGSQAKSELAATGAAAERTGANMRKLGQGGAAADTEMGKLRAELTRARAELDTLSTSEAAATARMAAMEAQAGRVAGQLRGVDRANTLAAGSLGNLTANFNDVAVMMAAGQNPMQLALQQGTQITQVIGPLGAAGAVKALGAAFLSMISPLNLVTLAVIAGGAALFQWATAADEADEETRTFSEQVDEAAGALQRAGRAADLASRGGLDDLRKKYGEISEQVIGLAQELAAIEQRAAIQEVRIAVDEASGDALRAEIDRIVGAVGTAIVGVGSDANLDEIRTAERQLRDLEAEISLLRLSGGTAAASDLERQAADMRAEIALLKGDLQGAEQLLAGLSFPPELAADIVTAQQALDEALVAEDFGQIADELHTIRTLLLATGTEIDQSVVDGLTAAEDLAQQTAARLDDAASNAAGIAGSGMVATLSAAASEASRIADEIVRAYDASISLAQQGRRSVEDAQIRLDFANDPVEQARQLGIARMRRTQGERWTHAEAPELSRLEAEARAYGDQMARVAELDQQRLEQLRTAREAGRGGAADQKAMSALIRDQQLQLELLRETDPVQKEMIRNREALIGATEAERLAVQKLIAERLGEEQAAARATAQGEFFRSSIAGVLTGLRQGSDEAVASIERVARALEDAAWQALLLGDGPLAGFIGGGEGGLIGQGLKFLFPNSPAAKGVPQNADGGYQYMPGGSRADAGLSWISSGEFIVNAAATSRNRGLLEFINSGGDPRSSMPAFASGGAFAAAPFVAGAPREVQLVNTTGNPLSATVEDEILPGGGRREKYVLSDAIGDALSRPGGASRALGRRYGLTPRGTRR